MLIGNSLPELIFIRLTVLAFRAIAPVSILYAALSIISRVEWIAGGHGLDIFIRYRVIRPPEVYLFLEAGFYLVVYIPFRVWLQHAAIHPKAPSKAERRLSWQRALSATKDWDGYLSGWYLGARPEAIDRHAVNEYVAWSLFNEHFEKLAAAEVLEVNEYSTDLERECGYKFVSGSGKTRSLRTTFDHVPMQHRPLFWYLIVAMVDSLTHVRLWFGSYRFYRPSLMTTLLSFPPRPLAMLGRPQQTPGQLSYWYRKHTSTTGHPIVFLHGIGIGLYAYTDFLLRLAAYREESDGEIGILVIEILPISSRIGPPALTTFELHSQVRQILKTHEWKEFVLIGHSYGTAIASAMLRDSAMANQIQAVMLMDPICFLLHLPDVAYNFTRRKPQRANERMLHYFSSQDMFISHTLARRFFWSEYILWREDFREDLPLVVTLSARDLIVPTREVWNYLTDSAAGDNVDREARALKGVTEWRDGNREVLLFEDLDHAGVFSSKSGRRTVANLARKLCT